MIFYITSNNYKQVISQTVKDSEEVVYGNECSDDFLLNDYVKKNVKNLMQIDTIIIDFTALKDSEEDIIEALEMFRIMIPNMRIVVIAPNRPCGDVLLKKCFQMSIYDIINSSDYVEIREELLHSIITGYTFKDALKFKDTDLNSSMNAIKQVKSAEKVRIAFVGTEKRIGVTHNAIMLANFLRKKGFAVALIEKNRSNDFDKIMNEFDEKKGDNNYFTINDIDYYSNMDAEALKKPYNFIIEDFGSYESCERDLFNTADFKLVIAGAKPWEIENVNSIFEYSLPEQLKDYHFFFNFVESRNMRDIKTGMGQIEKVYFLRYAEDPFQEFEFVHADELFKDYIPEEEISKKGFLQRFRKKKGKKNA